MILVVTMLLLTIITFIGLGFVNFKKGFKYNRYQFLSLLWLAVILFDCTTIVKANQVGIVYDQLNGGIQAETLGEGFHLKTPFQHVTQISTSNRTRSIETYAQSSSAPYASFEITVIYQIKKADAGLFFRATNNNDIDVTHFNAIVKENLQSNTTKFDIYDMLGSELEALRMGFETDLREELKTKYHITLVNLSIDDIDAGSEIEEIVKRKAEATQAIEIAEKEKEKALIDAQKELEIAAIKAQARLETAKGEGNAIKEIAEAEAQATRKKLQEVMIALGIELDENGVAVNLTSEQLVVITNYMKYIEYLATWNGELPHVVADGSGLILDIGG